MLMIYVGFKSLESETEKQDLEGANYLRLQERPQLARRLRS